MSRDLTTDDQGNIERAWQAILGIVPALERFVSFQFSPQGTQTAATMETVPTPNDPVAR